jgi:hypothetical protein
MENQSESVVNVSDDEERQKYLQLISKKLVYLILTCLIIFFILHYGINLITTTNSHTFLSLYIFLAGLVGGFISIQQRLPKIRLTELRELSKSWISILLIPVNGGVFAIVLAVMIISGILQGALFPTFIFDDKLEGIDKLLKVFPQTGVDLAKLLFWSFVAGFSERFVPQIIRKTSQNTENN